MGSGRPCRGLDTKPRHGAGSRCLCIDGTRCALWVVYVLARKLGVLVGDGQVSYVEEDDGRWVPRMETNDWVGWCCKNERKGTTPMPSLALGFSVVLIGATGVGLHVLYAVRCSIRIVSQSVESPRDEGNNEFF